MSTEDIHSAADTLDIVPTEEIIALMSSEDQNAVACVRKAAPAIAGAVHASVGTIESGGRLIYIGAGTSGRLGVLDASEIYPTFGVSGSIKAIIAGGGEALQSAVEGAEDDSEEGERSIADVNENDMLLGISASGRTPFVIGALKAGKHRGARCWLLTCNEITYDFLDGVIAVVTGPEVVAGSTRLKAGTATKMVLNMISTITMVRTGHVYRGRMIDVVPSSLKLISRALTMIGEITGCSEGEARRCLEASNNNPKTAVLMIMKKMDAEEAVKLLRDKGGSLRRALEA